MQALVALQLPLPACLAGVRVAKRMISQFGESWNCESRASGSKDGRAQDLPGLSAGQGSPLVSSHCLLPRLAQEPHSDSNLVLKGIKDAYTIIRR